MSNTKVPPRKKVQAATHQKTQRTSLAAPAERTAERRNWNVRLPLDVVEQAWGAMRLLEEVEPDKIHTTATFTARAFELLAQELADEHNSGEPIPPSTTNPVGRGRPSAF